MLSKSVRGLLHALETHTQGPYEQDVQTLFQRLLVKRPHNTEINLVLRQVAPGKTYYTIIITLSAAARWF